MLLHPQIPPHHPRDIICVWRTDRKVGLSKKLMRCHFGSYRILWKTSVTKHVVQATDIAQCQTRHTSKQDIAHMSCLKHYRGPTDQGDQLLHGGGEEVLLCDKVGVHKSMHYSALPWAMDHSLIKAALLSLYNLHEYLRLRNFEQSSPNIGSPCSMS